MRPSHALVCGTLLILVASCGGKQRYPRDANDAVLFAPAAMRVHPIFTQVADWTGDGKPDGVEALVELQDQFGDPTKASGRLVFELYDYRAYSPDPRGERLAFWNGLLATADDQAERWNRTSRTYGFPLAYPQIRTDRAYVLHATFELTAGGRFFDRIIIEPRDRPPAAPAAPATNPAAMGTMQPR